MTNKKKYGIISFGAAALGLVDAWVGAYASHKGMSWAEFPFLVTGGALTVVAFFFGFAYAEATD